MQEKKLEKPGLYLQQSEIRNFRTGPTTSMPSNWQKAQLLVK